MNKKEPKIAPMTVAIAFLGFVQTEPAHIPQYASLFVIGLFAGPRRWLETMPTQLGLIWLAVGGGLAIMISLGIIGSAASGGDNASSNWRTCAYEAFLCVGLCVGLRAISGTAARSRPVVAGAGGQPLNMRRSRSLCRKRPCLFLENVE